MELIPYRDDRLVLVSSSRHPVAQAASVDFLDTLRYDYVSLDESSAIHRFLMQAASRAGRKLNSRIEVASFQGVCSLVEAGVGIGVVPVSAAARHAATMQIKITQLRDEWAACKLRICVRSVDKLPSFVRVLVESLATGGSQFTQCEARPSETRIAMAAMPA